MFNFVIYSILILLLIMLIWITYHFRFLTNENSESETEGYKNKLIGSHNFIYAAIVLVTITILVFTYMLVKNTPMEGHVMEWLNIIVRVMHITFGIAWIGASFYFVFLENALNRTENIRDEIAGNLWAIHGGGFYYLEKYKTAPKSIPKHLHWFKYEAYFTWLSGISLLFIVYYFDAKGFLIDKNIFDMSTAAAIVTGIGSFVVGWLLYDILCKTSLIKKGIWFALTGFIIATAFAWFYTHVFSARAAYIHFGAMLGSIMVANVFFVIIPSQKAMVKAAREGKPLNANSGKQAGLRSLHNNYLTLPVLFTMVSNHFPGTFGYQYPWIILAAISLSTAGIKHWLNLREQGKYSVWVMPVSIVLLLGMAYVSAPPKQGECKTIISFTEVNAIVQSRCVSCHSSQPTDDVIKAPPNGVTYDTPENIVKLKDKIMQRVVLTKTMPQNNKTNMTMEEREIIRCWIEQGASLK